jgi:hypothetical protein
MAPSIRAVGSEPGELGHLARRARALVQRMGTLRRGRMMGERREHPQQLASVAKIIPALPTRPPVGPDDPSDERWPG